jgi:hypothetical protein
MPKIPRFPKDLRVYPETFARELYVYRVVGRGIPHVFYKEFEDRERAKEEVHGGEVEFRFHDLIMFFAAAAASGVIGNLTYDAIRKAIEGIRKPQREVASKGIRFESVVSRKTYNRLRRERNPRTRAHRSSSLELEEKVDTEYRLMVSLNQSRRKR